MKGLVQEGWQGLPSMAVPHPKITRMSACIVCGATPVTRAHLYGRALRRLFPLDHRSLHFIGGEVVNPSRRLDGRGVRFQQRASLCSRCNGGWMGALEQRALPLLAALVGDGGRNTSTEIESISVSDAEAIAQWAAVVTILRGELVPEVRSVNAATIAALRASGLAGIDARVWMLNLEVSLNSQESEAPASSYWTSTDENEQGCVALFFLRSVCVAVAFGHFVPQSAVGMRILGKAAVKLWPAPDMISWPLTSSVERVVLLRALGAADRAAPEVLSRGHIRLTP